MIRTKNSEVENREQLCVQWIFSTNSAPEEEILWVAKGALKGIVFINPDWISLVHTKIEFNSHKWEKLNEKKKTEKCANRVSLSEDGICFW